MGKYSKEREDRRRDKNTDRSKNKQIIRWDVKERI
jgi:hypothetical protein